MIWCFAGFSNQRLKFYTGELSGKVANNRIGANNRITPVIFSPDNSTRNTRRYNEKWPGTSSRDLFIFHFAQSLNASSVTRAFPCYYIICLFAFRLIINSHVPLFFCKTQDSPFLLLLPLIPFLSNETMVGRNETVARISRGTFAHLVTRKKVNWLPRDRGIYEGVKTSKTP